MVEFHDGAQIYDTDRIPWNYRPTSTDSKIFGRIHEIYKNELQGEKVGIGVITYYDETETAIYIAEISEKSPAMQSGLSKGDKIIAIDEEEVTAYNYEELMEIVKQCQYIAVKAGAPSVMSYVKITYKPDGEKLTIERKTAKHHINDIAKAMKSA